MKPPAFRYIVTNSIEEAAQKLEQEGDGAKILAGGQSLTPMLNFRLARPTALIDINRIDGLSGISGDSGGLRIGALVRHHDIETSDTVRDSIPLLTAAAEQVGHLAIRNRGTFVGSLAHNDPAGEWPMVARLYDAEMTAQSAAGSRTISAEDFFVSYLTTSLKDNEILTEVRIPAGPAGSGWGFEELSRRPGDFALAAVCALVTVSGGKCTEARISMGGVGPTPLRASAAEALLQGQSLDEDAITAAGAKAAEESDPSNDVHASAEFRRHLVSVLTRRALAAAVERAA